MTYVGTECTVSTWGRWTDEDGTEWQRWSVRAKGGRHGYLLLPLDDDPENALLVAELGFAWEDL